MKKTQTPDNQKSFDFSALLDEYEEIKADLVSVASEPVEVHHGSHN